jgi:hypothetical protein
MAGEVQVTVSEASGNTKVERESILATEVKDFTKEKKHGAHGESASEDASDSGERIEQVANLRLILSGLWVRSFSLFP